MLTVAPRILLVCRISTGTLILFTYCQIHHDEREWGEPEKVWPQQLLNSNGDFVRWNKLCGFIPFSVDNDDVYVCCEVITAL